MSIFNYLITIDKAEIVVLSQEAARLSACLVTQYGAKLISAPREVEKQGYVKLILDLPDESEKRGLLSADLFRRIESQRLSSAPQG